MAVVIPAPPIEIEQLRELVAIHKKKRLKLAFTVGLDGQVHMGGDPQAPVTELLHMATLGFFAIDAAENGRPVDEALSAADAAWRAGIVP